MSEESAGNLFLSTTCHRNCLEQTRQGGKLLTIISDNFPCNLPISQETCEDRETGAVKCWLSLLRADPRRKPETATLHNEHIILDKVQFSALLLSSNLMK